MLFSKNQRNIKITVDINSFLPAILLKSGTRLSTFCVLIYRNHHLVEEAKDERGV